MARRNWDIVASKCHGSGPGPLVYSYFGSVNLSKLGDVLSERQGASKHAL